MADCLVIYFHNDQPTDTHSTSEHALQFSIAQLDSSSQTAGISRSHVVSRFLFYGDVFSSFFKKFSLIFASLKRLNWLLVICVSLETMHSICCSCLKFRLLNSPLPQGSRALRHVAFKHQSIVAGQHHF